MTKFHKNTNIVKSILLSIFVGILFITTMMTSTAYSEIDEKIFRDLAASMAEPGEILIDNAGVISEDAEARLKKQMLDVSEKRKAQLVIVTVNSIGTYTARDYAANFYDYNGYGYGKKNNGVLVLYKHGEIGDRDLWIATTGDAIRQFTDAEIELALDDLQYNIVDGDYDTAFASFIHNSDKFLKLPTPSIKSAILGMFVAAIIVLVYRSRQKNLIKTPTNESPASYIVPNSVNIKKNEKVLISSVTTVHSSSGGGSGGGGGGGGGGSSGTSHGGGGRSF